MICKWDQLPIDDFYGSYCENYLILQVLNVIFNTSIENTETSCKNVPCKIIKRKLKEGRNTAVRRQMRLTEIIKGVRGHIRLKVKVQRLRGFALRAVGEAVGAQVTMCLLWFWPRGLVEGVPIHSDLKGQWDTGGWGQRSNEKFKGQIIDQIYMYLFIPNSAFIWCLYLFYIHVSSLMLINKEFTIQNVQKWRKVYFL